MQMPIETVLELTRDAVQEVFHSMLSLELSQDSPGPLLNEGHEQIAGSVGFTGPLHGIVYLFAEVAFAKILTARMLGMREEEIEEMEMVNDAFGELSNMVGGYVKSRLCDGGCPCTLTIPSIVRGRQLSIERITNVTRRMISFKAGTERLLVELLVKDASS